MDYVIAYIQRIHYRHCESGLVQRLHPFDGFIAFLFIMNQCEFFHVREAYDAAGKCKDFTFLDIYFTKHSCVNLHTLLPPIHYTIRCNSLNCFAISYRLPEEQRRK